MQSARFPLLIALLLGLLVSLNPCQLAINVSALTYLHKNTKQKNRGFLIGIIYTIGRSLTYIVLGWALTILIKQGNNIEIVRSLLSKSDIVGNRHFPNHQSGHLTQPSSWRQLPQLRLLNQQKRDSRSADTWKHTGTGLLSRECNILFCDVDTSICFNSLRMDNPDSIRFFGCHPNNNLVMANINSHALPKEDRAYIRPCPTNNKHYHRNNIHHHRNNLFYLNLKTKIET